MHNETIAHPDIVPLEQVNIPVCDTKGTPVKVVEFKLDTLVLCDSHEAYVADESLITAEDSRDMSDPYKSGHLSLHTTSLALLYLF